MKTKALLGILAAAGLFVANAFGQSVSTITTNNFFEPHTVVVNGSLYYVTDSSHNRILSFAPSTATFNQIAGDPDGFSGTNNGPGISASFSNPQGMVIARGGLVVADQFNHTLRFVSFDGLTVSNLAGVPTVPGNGNGPAATATFRFPTGLTVDGNGNIYIADSKNNSIRKLDTNNVVSTYATGFNQPNGVSIGDNGELWVADTLNHQIKVVDTNGVVTVRAGSGVSGYQDSNAGTLARFTSPRGVLWMGAGAGLLVADTGNNLIRRVYANSISGGYKVELSAGIPFQAGLADGPTNAAKFNAPIGLAVDSLNGAFLVVDSANNALRRIQLSPVQPKISDPQIGFVVIDAATGKTRLVPVIQSVFNNDVTIAILSEAQGVQTFFSTGPSPTNAFLDTVLDPSPLTGTAQRYEDGASAFPAAYIGIIPDLTVKAISSQDGRTPSSIVKARFQFKTGTPVVNGENGASFTVTDISAATALYYTIDGSDPTNGPPSIGPLVSGSVISLNLNNTNVTFKVMAFKDKYEPSPVVTKVFSATNFVANQISLGFALGEASSDYIAAPGQKFYCPVTLSLLDGQRIESMGFTIGVTNITAPPVAPGAFGFTSMLERTAPELGPGIFVYLPPVFFVGPSNSITVTNGILTTNVVAGFTNATFQTLSNNLLGVAWLETHGAKNLYDTTAQDLVTYSQPHITQFNKPNVVAGGYSFDVPVDAPIGSTYRIQVFNASGSYNYDQLTSIFAPTNGPLGPGKINSIKEVTVGIRSYLVGDVSNFRWFNSGEFGNGTLNSDDANQVFQTAIYGLFYPPLGSDFFDAMDSSNGSINPGLNTSSGDIDGVLYGDGQINVDDVFVTLRRSLDPYSKWYARYWTNTVIGGVTNATKVAVEVPNTLPKPTYGLPSVPATTLSVNSAANPADSRLSFSAGDTVTSGGLVSIPIKLKVEGDYPVRVMMFGLKVVPLDDSPILVQPVQFEILQSTTDALGAPLYLRNIGNSIYGAAWLNASSVGLPAGDYVLGNLKITLPANAPASAAYTVEFSHASASPTGIKLISRQIFKGLITLADRSNSSRNDGIPDAWRLKYFRSIGKIFAGTNNVDITDAMADADGDGIPNWAEFKAGTDPYDATSTLLLAGKRSTNGVSFNLPTVANKTYVIEASTSLSGDWTAVSTNILGTGASIDFQESNPTGVLRFYRVRLVEP